MSELTHKKMSLAFALLSFGVMVFGSVLSGSGVITAFIRGTEAAILFGLLVWGLGTMLVQADGEHHDSGEHAKGEAKGKKLDHSV